MSVICSVCVPLVSHRSPSLKLNCDNTLHFASDQQLSVLSPALHSHDIDIDKLTAGGYSHRNGIMSRNSLLVPSGRDLWLMGRILVLTPCAL